MGNRNSMVNADVKIRFQNSNSTEPEAGTIPPITKNTWSSWNRERKRIHVAFDSIPHASD